MHVTQALSIAELLHLLAVRAESFCFAPQAKSPYGPSNTLAPERETKPWLSNSCQGWLSREDLKPYYE